MGRTCYFFFLKNKSGGSRLKGERSGCSGVVFADSASVIAGLLFRQFVKRDHAHMWPMAPAISAGGWILCYRKGCELLRRVYLTRAYVQMLDRPGCAPA